MGFLKKAKKRIKRGRKNITGGLKDSIKGIKEGDIKAALVGANRVGVGMTDTASFGGTGGLNQALRKQIDPLLGFGVNDDGSSFNLKDESKDKALRRVAFQQGQAEIIAQEAEDEEKKRRRRRGNIFTSPLGALVSNALTTRKLTGA
jgi:hypothetical protein